ncbi:O-antigen ligase family protein [Vibrio breoganii]
MNNKSKNRDTINNFLISISIYLSAITIPLKNLFGNGIPVTVVVLIMFLVSLFVNNKINIKLVTVMLFLLMLITLDGLFLSTSGEVKYLIEFCKKSLVILYFSYYVKLNFNFITVFRKVSILACVIYLANFDMLFSKELSYMDFGNMIVMVVLSLSLSIFVNNEKNTVNYLLLFIVLALTLLFANRMALICAIVAMLIVWIFASNRIYQQLVKSTVLVLMLSFITVLFLNNLTGLLELLQSLGYYSYSLNKIDLAYQEGISSSSSGRTELYRSALSLMLDNPLKIKGLSFFTDQTDAPYPHNLFLDLGIVFGVPLGVTIFLLYCIIPLYLLRIKDKLTLTVLLAVWSISFTRLSLSSSFIIEPTVWLLVGLFFKNNTNTKFTNTI